MECAYCGMKVNQPTGAINRAKKKGFPIYCNKVCAGLGRRKNKTIEQKKEEKRIYDMEYRKKNRAKLKALKAMRYQRDRDPVKEAAYRKAHMRRHVEYCRTPEYKAWKKEYDQKFRAKKFYGEFWESAILALAIDREIESRMDWVEVAREKGTINKTQQRRREYESTYSKKSERRAVGNSLRY